MSVSVFRAVSLRPFRVKFTVDAGVGSTSGCNAMTAFMAASAQLVRKVFEDAIDRVRGSLPQAADGGIAHDLRQIRQQRLIPMVMDDECAGFGGADAAGGALTAGFMFKETHHVTGRVLGGIVIGQH